MKNILLVAILVAFLNGCAKFEPIIDTKGKSKFEETGGGRGGLTMRGEIGGGKIEYVSSRTAELDWLPKYLRGGSLQQTIKLELNKSLKKAKGKKLK